MQIESKTPLILIAAAGLLVLVGRLVYPHIGPPLVINYTDSEPHGLYYLTVHRNRQYARGTEISFPVPASFRALIYGRGWLYRGLPLVKNVGALPGDQVCIENGQQRINGGAPAPVFTKDSLGRPLPRLRGCYTIAPGEFLPLSTYIPNSFDGRYMGPQPISSILGEVHPLWVFSAH